MISKKEVQHIAKLARIGITEKEEEGFQKDLSSILEYIEKLEKVDVSGVEPTSHPFKIKNVVRQDTSSKQENQGAKLLESAVEIKDGYIKVKSVFE